MLQICHYEKYVTSANKILNEVYVQYPIQSNFILIKSLGYSGFCVVYLI